MCFAGAYGALSQSVTLRRSLDCHNAFKVDLGFEKLFIRARCHLNNVWALQECHECLTRLGKTEEVAVIEPAVELALALTTSDPSVQYPCFCKLISQVSRLLKVVASILTVTRT